MRQMLLGGYVFERPLERFLHRLAAAPWVLVFVLPPFPPSLILFEFPCHEVDCGAGGSEVVQKLFHGTHVFQAHLATILNRGAKGDFEFGQVFILSYMHQVVQKPFQKQ